MNEARRAALHEAEEVLNSERPPLDAVATLIAQLERVDPACVDAETQVARARLLVLAGERAAAREVLERILSLDPTNADAHFSLGVQLSDDGDVEGAIRHWSEVPSESTMYEDAAYNIGQAAYLSGRFEEALSAWQRLLVLDPDDWQVQRKVVQALHALDRHDAAEAAFLDLRARWQAHSRSERVGAEVARAPQYFIVDQFRVRHLTILVKEQVSECRENLSVPIAFVAHPRVDAPPLFAIELSSTAYGAERGSEFALQFHAPYATKIIGPIWNVRPEYGVLREAARVAVLRELDERGAGER